VTNPTIANAPRHPTASTSHASGAADVREPRTPTVALSAESVPNRAAENHTLALLRTPTNVTVAPAPTRKRPADSIHEPVAADIASVPSPITTPPAATTRRTPYASISTPPGIMKPAYA